MTIIDALRDPQLFGALPAFQDLSTWRNWLVFLKAVYGLPLDQDEEAVFKRHTGRTASAPPPGGFREAVMIVGRQSGKTRIAAALAAFEAIMATREPDRTSLYAALIAQDHRAALRTLFSYAAVPFEHVPLLRGTVVARTAETLALESGVVLAAYPCRPPAVRGIRAKVVVADELAFYRSAEGNPQDLEMLRAVRPLLATTGGRLIVLSSPYGQSGALWELYRAHFGRDDSPVLIWKATAPEMNPTLARDYLERMAQDDPEGYRSEVLGEFRAGISMLFDPEALEACMVRGCRERLPQEGLAYRAFADPSGGRRDAFTVAVGHREGERIVLDALRAWPAPFNPSGVVAEAAGFLRRYRVIRVTGDRFGGMWPVEAFRGHGVSYESADLDRSALYLELLPVVNAGAVELLDLPDLLRELRGLERRRGPSGRDRVVPAPHDHDDRANVVAGVVSLLARRRQKMLEEWRPGPASAQEKKPCHMHGRAQCPACNPGWSWRDLQRGDVGMGLWW